MTETLNGKQVLALLAQDEPPGIEECDRLSDRWVTFIPSSWSVQALLSTTSCKFRIKPTPARRLSVTLANGEVVSWPEPVREALSYGHVFWFVDVDGGVFDSTWKQGECDKSCLKFGNVHLTREAAQEHADALRKINTQGAV